MECVCVCVCVRVRCCEDEEGDVGRQDGAESEQAWNETTAQVGGETRCVISSRPVFRRLPAEKEERAHNGRCSAPPFLKGGITFSLSFPTNWISSEFNCT